MVSQYEIAFDMILDLQQEIISVLKAEANAPDSRSVHALSATCILQDYLAGRIAALGESPEGKDWDSLTWDRIKEMIAYYESSESIDER